MGGWRLTLAWIILAATVYSGSYTGKTMANGQRYDPSNPKIAACNRFPLGTEIVVCNRDKPVCTNAVVMDRMKRDGVIDLSPALAAKLGVVGRGRVKVRTAFKHLNDF